MVTAAGLKAAAAANNLAEGGRASLLNAVRTGDQQGAVEESNDTSVSGSERTIRRRAHRRQSASAARAKIEELSKEVTVLRATVEALLAGGCSQLDAREKAVLASLRLHVAACNHLQADVHWAHEALQMAGWASQLNRSILDRGSAGRHHGLFSTRPMAFARLADEDIKKLCRAAHKAVPTDASRRSGRSVAVAADVAGRIADVDLAQDEFYHAIAADIAVQCKPACAMDWPLCVREKVRLTMSLYARDLEVANELLEAPVQEQVASGGSSGVLSSTSAHAECQTDVSAPPTTYVDASGSPASDAIAGLQGVAAERLEAHRNCLESVDRLLNFAPLSEFGCQDDGRCVSGVLPSQFDFLAGDMACKKALDMVEAFKQAACDYHEQAEHRRAAAKGVQLCDTNCSRADSGDERSSKRWEDIFDRLAAESGALDFTMWQEIASDPDEGELYRIWLRVINELRESGSSLQTKAPSLTEVCARFRGEIALEGPRTDSGDVRSSEGWEDIFDRLAAESGAQDFTVWQRIASDPDECELYRIWMRILGEQWKSGSYRIKAPSFTEVCARFRGEIALECQGSTSD